MGGGIFGLSCAWEMARRGAKVRLIEAARIGAGASGGHLGALAPHSPENWTAKKDVQLNSLLRAEAFWREVEAASGLPTGYRRSGRLQPVTDPEALTGRIAAAGRHWPAGIGMRLIDSPETPLAGPGLWLQDDLTARLNPRAALAALAAAIRTKGGEVIEGRNVAPKGPTLWATGHQGLQDLNRATGRAFSTGVKGQSALLRFALPDSPQIFADGLYIIPHADGTTAIGSTSENNVTHAGTDHQLEDLIEQARALCPALAGAPVIDRWSGIRPRARSRAPLLGPWPGRPGHFVANGGFKIGFGMAPAIAAIMADLILDNRDAIPDGFRLR